MTARSWNRFGQSGPFGRVAGQRDLLVVVALLIVLIASGIVSYLQKSPETGQGTRYSTYAAGADGTLGLYRWLPTLGYDVRRVQRVPFSISPDLRAIFVIAPSDSYSQGEAALLIAWVRNGGRVVIALDSDNPALLHSLGARLLPLPPGTDAALWAAQPLLTRPLVQHLRGRAMTGVALETSRVVPYLVGGTSRRHVDVLVGRHLGRGLLYLLGAPSTLSNRDIMVADNRLLALNLLGGLPMGARVGFDEFHHGVRIHDAQEVGDLLFTTPLGHALLYGGLVLLTYLWLSGRRLGRPVSNRRPTARSISEYIVSLGALYRRSGARADALGSARRGFVAEVAQALHIDSRVLAPDPDQGLIRVLEHQGLLTTGERTELQMLLAPPREPDLTEAELVRRVRALDRFHTQLTRTE